MKITVEVDETLACPEITIRTPELNEHIACLQRLLAQSTTTLAVFKNESEYYISLQDILFFETDDKTVMAHTVSERYETGLRLYELEERLPGSFLRISKSAIVNMDRIFSLTRHMSSCRIEFQDTPEHVYASRQYYKHLTEKLDERRTQYE